MKILLNAYIDLGENSKVTLGNGFWISFERSEMDWLVEYIAMFYKIVSISPRRKENLLTGKGSKVNFCNIVNLITEIQQVLLKMQDKSFSTLFKRGDKINELANFSLLVDGIKIKNELEEAILKYYMFDKSDNLVIEPNYDFTKDLEFCRNIK